MKENILKQIGNMIKNETEEIIEQRKVRYLNKFMNSLIQKKILATSPLLYEFLILDNNKFKQYQDLIQTKKYDLEVSLRNLITTKGKIKCSVSKKMIDGANNMVNKSIFMYDIYNKIDASMNNIINSFNNLSFSMKEISYYFDILKKNMSILQCNSSENLKKNFVNFKNIFDSWSVTLKKQSIFLNEEFRENFNYMALELDAMNLINKKYSDYKKEYEDENSIINNKKEILYLSKSYDKWGVQPGTENTINTFKDNKKVAFEKMLYNESLVLNEEQKRINVTIYKMDKEFEKIMKKHNEKIQKIYESLKENIRFQFLKE
jgi:hypothetical protein